MNQLLTILNKLKAGKRVKIINPAQRKGILGVLNAYQIKTYVDGLFVQIEPEDGESCAHKNTRKTGDIMVLSDGYEIGIAVCKDCGKEVPEKEDES